MSLIDNYKNRGDTLVEVLFSTAVFSLVAVGCLSIMNQGTATAERALEIALVRKEIDAQAETLRFLNASFIAAYTEGVSNYPGTPADEWHLIQAEAPTEATISDLSNCNPILNPNSFVLNTRTAKFVPPTGAGRPSLAKTFSQVTYDALSNNVLSVEGIWIEAVTVSPGGADQGNADYLDFHIRACWDGPGQSIPVTLGTIVRLYEPR